MTKSILVAEATWESLNNVVFTPAEYDAIPDLTRSCMEMQGYFEFESYHSLNESIKETYTYKWLDGGRPTDSVLAIGNKTLIELNKYIVEAGNVVYVVYERIYEMEIV